MANQDSENFTKVPNTFLESIGRHKFNGTQRGIIDQVWRYTIGFNRPAAELSLTFLAKALCVGKSQVDRELTALIQRNVIHVVGEGKGKSRQLKFNYDFDSWLAKCPLNRGRSELVQGVLELEDGVSSKKSTEPSSKKSTKKERKESIKERNIYMDKIQFLDTVYLTQEQYDRLCNDFGKETTDLFIEKLDEWQTNYPKKQKVDHNKTIRVWIKNENARKKQFPSIQTKQQKNEQQMDVLAQFSMESDGDEQARDGFVPGGRQNSLPPLRDH